MPYIYVSKIIKVKVERERNSGKYDRLALKMQFNRIYGILTVRAKKKKTGTESGYNDVECIFWEYCYLYAPPNVCVCVRRWIDPHILCAYVTSTLYLYIGYSILDYRHQLFTESLVKFAWIHTSTYTNTCPRARSRTQLLFEIVAIFFITSNRMVENTQTHTTLRIVGIA